MVRHWRSWFASALALVFFIAIATLPYAIHNGAVPPWVQSAQRTSPVPLTAPNDLLPPVALSPNATPDQPDAAPAALPAADSIRMASLVAGEDLRLRTLLHHVGRLAYPTVEAPSPQVDVVSGVTRSNKPTLVLPGPATYSIADLQAAGAALPLAQGGYLLIENVLVAPGATLKLDSADVPRLLMEISTEGFTSLVTWGGTLTLTGQATKPLVIVGWDRTVNQPAADRGFGRPYIRAVGGRLDLRFVHASSLGFWSGRTGGVSWTGISSKASTGSAISSRFIGNTYGAFVSRASHVDFSDDLFEGNELDGLRLHRNTVSSTVTASAAARNGGNGFVVSRGASGNVLRGDIAVNNQGNGFLVNGLPLVSGASPSGSNAVASSGTMLQDSDAERNGRTGILVEGGAGTIIRNNIVCATVTGIAVRAGAVDTMIVGNEVRCGGRVALSIGPQVFGTTVAGNTFNAARIGILIRNSSGVRIIENRITGVSVFAISIRGLSPGVVGNDNLIAGRGFQPIDTRSGAVTPTITTSNLGGWQHRSSLTALQSLRYHPLLVTWLVILAFVVASSILIRFRRAPAQPYYYVVPWRPTMQPANGHAPHDERDAIPDTVVVVAANAGRTARRRKRPTAATARAPRHATNGAKPATLIETNEDGVTA